MTGRAKLPAVGSWVVRLGQKRAHQVVRWSIPGCLGVLLSDGVWEYPPLVRPATPEETGLAQLGPAGPLEGL